MDEAGPAVDDELRRDGLHIFFCIFEEAVTASDPQGMRRGFREGLSPGKDDVFLPHRDAPAAAVRSETHIIQRKSCASRPAHLCIRGFRQKRRQFFRIAARDPDFFHRDPHIEGQRLFHVFQIQNEYICLLHPFVGEDGIPLPEGGV